MSSTSVRRVRIVPFNEDTAREVTAHCMRGRIITRARGCSVRVICWNARGEFPIVGLIDLEGEERAWQYTREGKADRRPNVRTDLDLLIELEHE